MNQTNKTAVITGGSQGIGRAVSEKFLQQGWQVAICARTDASLQEVLTTWKKEFPNATILAMPVDLSKADEVAHFATAILKQFTTVDVLVNNAGLFFPGTLAEEPEGHLEQLMAVNVYSAYHLTRQLLPQMKAHQIGHIFNMCSVASLRAYDNGGAYSITKYALLGFSDNLRKELMPFQIKVTAVMPGATWSRSWAASGVEKERMMLPEDIAALIWNATQLSANANVDHIVIRPLKGDI